LPSAPLGDERVHRGGHGHVDGVADRARHVPADVVDGGEHPRLASWSSTTASMAMVAPDSASSSVATRTPRGSTSSSPLAQTCSIAARACRAERGERAHSTTVPVRRRGRGQPERDRAGADHRHPFLRRALPP
jgi:hypothetical protein